MKQWHKAATIFSIAWIVLLGIYVGVATYHQFACTPTVENLPNGTIVRHACLHGPVSQRVILYTVAYFGGGVSETLDIGEDLGTAVSEEYAVPFAFSGKIETVKVDVK